MLEKKLFADGTIQSEEKGFLEELLEAIPLVADSEDMGNTIEYQDEYGSVLFCVDLVGDNSYLFRFYENAYPVDEPTLKKIQQILGASKDEDEIEESDVRSASN